MRKRLRLTAADTERNNARLAEINQWIKQVDLKYWHIDSVPSIGGYIIGVCMTYLPTGFTLIAGSLDEVREVERMEGGAA